MRADRLLSILLLLQTNGRMTAAELAQRLEVSERTIHRDMEALSTAGVPVIAERGAGGGWALLEPYRTDLTGLSATEMQTLYLMQSARLLEDLGLKQAADSALLKLLAAMPAVSRRRAEHLRHSIYVDAAGWKRWDEAAPCLPTVQDALWQGRKLTIQYRRGDDGEVVERLIDPLGLVAKGSIWYLVGAVAGELRTYRLSRVQAAQISEQPLERPENFDLAAYWQQSVREFQQALPRYPALLRLAPGMVERIPAAWRYARVQQVIATAADGWVTACVDFQAMDYAGEAILSFGPRVEVLEPAELRAHVAELARATAAVYAGGA